jgi:hypothetical protein
MYLFLMYDHDSNFINAIPLHSRKTPELIRAFKECYNELSDHGLTARLLKLVGGVISISIAPTY